ncbi:hypothetical protein EDB86DRAFT_3103736 [Lactarius hatsudake]|nr:hypothetical protein EDB86DRAFT_3110380 [Lactarius hatsudake]KAH8991395.1 hypothetical protein EDB86DRAFT_3103736 [Lactarius hatsudake]
MPVYFFEGIDYRPFQRQRKIYDVAVKYYPHQLLDGVRYGQDPKEHEREQIVPAISKVTKSYAGAYARAGPGPAAPRPSLSPRSERSTSTRLSVRLFPTSLVRPQTLDYLSALRYAVKDINNMHMQNVLMQLRKSTRTRSCSKPTLFSQFVTLLDVIEDWRASARDGSCAVLMVGRARLAGAPRGDGPLPAGRRRARCTVPCLFLLGTRAGGLSINMIRADTVVFYDQDWNPADRPVLISGSSARSRGRSASSGCRLSLKARHGLTLAFLISSSHTNILPLGQFKKPICSNAKAETPRTIAEMATGVEAVKEELTRVRTMGQRRIGGILASNSHHLPLTCGAAKFSLKGTSKNPSLFQFSV